jgi:hypothetical protein
MAYVYMGMVSAAILGRLAFSTRRGWLGLGPQHAKAGDEVILLQGMQTPMILRPSRKGRYTLEGEAYVHGIMDGEFVEREKPLEELFVLE